MKYRRLLLVTDLAADAGGALAAIRALLPFADYCAVLACLPERGLGWFDDEASPELEQPGSAALEQLRTALSAVHTEVDIRLAPAPGVEALDQLAQDTGVDLLVIGPFSFGSTLAGITHMVALRKRRPLAVLWVPDQVSADPAGARRGATQLVCLATGRRAGAAVTSFLREHGDPAQQVTVLQTAAEPPPDGVVALDVSGISAPVELLTAGPLVISQWLDERAQARALDLLVVAHLPAALLLASRSAAPCLVLPPVPPLERPLVERSLDGPDLVDLGSPLHARFEYATSIGIGRRTVIPDQTLAFVAGGRVLAELGSRAGDVSWAYDGDAHACGVFRTEGRGTAQPLAAIELQLAILRPGPTPVLLFDAELSDEEMDALHQATLHLVPQRRPTWLAVRLRPVRNCRLIRSRLQAAGLPARVIDASVVLDEGDALDVPELADPVRLARVAGRLRAAAFPIVAIVHRAELAPSTIGFVALRADEIDAQCLAALPPVPVPAPPATLAERLDHMTGAPLIAGNRIEVELDNALARRWLLAAIEASVERIHFQTYMAADDDIGRLVEAALVRAAARGVTVRLLVDSLHGLHGSLGASNPLLERLGAVPGIELRVGQPINGVPSLEALKQRDHRKLVIVDNRVALLGGRNLAHEYYTGFDEVALGRRSMWHEVPWLDAGARVEGPAVTAIEQGFLVAWQATGGQGWPVAACAVSGHTNARVVTHQGLRDAHTLDAYLALIDEARSHLHVVNGFPLILEIQHALLRALQRGVRVSVLTGNLMPRHGEQPFSGPWSGVRAAATEFVHSRVDALVAAGAQARQFTMAPQAGWAAGLGPVHSHVHAKLMCADGRVCALGSANMDITGGYWESELLLVIEDGAMATAVEARIEALMAGSTPMDRNDTQWRQLAERRAWMRYWPGVLSL